MIFPLRKLEDYEPDDLVNDLNARKPIRVTIPESVARFQPLSHLDWSQKLELAPPAGLLDGNTHEGRAPRMDDLDARYQGLVSLTYQLGGKVHYRMLGGERYAARVAWGADPAES